MNLVSRLEVVEQQVDVRLQGDVDQDGEEGLGVAVHPEADLNRLDGALEDGHLHEGTLEVVQLRKLGDCQSDVVDLQELGLETQHLGSDHLAQKRNLVSYLLAL